MTDTSPSLYPPQAATVAIQTRFGDMDAYGHINNVVLFRYVEEARVRVLFPLVGAWNLRFLVARQEAEYRSILQYGTSEATVHIWSTRISNSSFDLGYAIEDPQGIVTTLAASTMVVIGENNQPTPIPPPLREWLDKVAGPPIVFRGK